MAPQRNRDSSRHTSSATPGPSRQIVSKRGSLNRRQNSIEPSLTPIRRLRHKNAGKISVQGIFNGLNPDEASNSMKLIKEEFNRFMAEQGKGKGRAIDPEEDIEAESDSHSDEETDKDESDMAEEEVQERIDGKQMSEEQRYQQLVVFWGKRNWSTIFSFYTEYDSKSTLKLSSWNRFISWFWQALSKEHMAEQQDVLQRLRTSTSLAPKVADKPHVSALGLQLEEDVLRDYQKVLRSLNTEDLSKLVQRFHLAKLYGSHCAYVAHLRLRPMNPQTARQTVNQILSTFFSQKQGKKISIQTIKNQVQAGRHWHEFMHANETRGFGVGLTLLLPTRKFADLAHTTSDDVWTFLYQCLPKMPRRLIDLAKSLEPIGNALQTEGIGNVKIPLLGYELRAATDLTKLDTAKFEACRVSYPDLDCKAAFRTIAAFHRTEDPNKIPNLVRNEWELKNLRDGHAYLDEADRAERSGYRRGVVLRAHARGRFAQAASDAESSEDTDESSEDSSTTTTTQLDIATPIPASGNSTQV